MEMSAVAADAAGDSKPDSNKLESVIQVRGRGARPAAAHQATVTGTPLRRGVNSPLLLSLSWLLVNCLSWSSSLIFLM